MARIVQKFGGTSVADLDRIRAVAQRVKAEVDAGNEVAVVVSAMSGTTNQLVEWSREIGPVHDAREYDVVVSTGEQVTVGLLAIALQNIGIDARSWLGWQIALHTNDVHGSARIESIDTDKLDERLSSGQVAVVAGFQGIGPDGRISTLGRGGSDTSAVALAAALNADRCDIYTDVDGVYTTDPRMMPKARKLERITFEEMLEMASAGAKVLETRSVAMAMRYDVNLQVLSSFSDQPGTLVVNEEQNMEQQKISGIAYSRDEAKITLVGLPDRPGIAAYIFGVLADNHINVDMIVQSASADKTQTDITFSLGSLDVEKAIGVLKAEEQKLEYKDIVGDVDVAKISIIGTAMRTQPGIAKTMFSVLAEKGINLHVISTSEIKISVLVDTNYTELAVRSLHDAFQLDEA
ncbi:MAG: aspartate kinase [Alphaproteobacteria bacterium]|jgi:aspartate kinase|nr:aspartate kinase [Alphaproteobacteria bacterium]MDA8882431.1 aspartate kinase [Alphaproteobacteria bacterium]MDA8915347.1 aspartate kinase [Alphaproteobacteria bacterium]|tara:strand:+ start:1357 stop:2577 length:1221 start_codon:yes stop_codon:yes gene_type:complete